VLEFLALRLLLLRPFRCHSCDNRYYGWFFSRRGRSRQVASTWVSQSSRDSRLATLALKESRGRSQKKGLQPSAFSVHTS